MKRSDDTIIQFIAIISILLAAKQNVVSSFIGKLFPFADIAIPAVSFIFLYKCLVWLYRTYLWKTAHREIYLGGQWIYVITDISGNHNVYGKFTVRHNPDAANVTDGIHWYCWDKDTLSNARGTWHGAFVDRPGGENNRLLWWEVSVQEARKNDADTGDHYLGIADLSIVKRDDKQNAIFLSGNFRDLAKRPNWGKMYIGKIDRANEVDLKEAAKRLLDI